MNYKLTIHINSETQLQTLKDCAAHYFETKPTKKDLAAVATAAMGIGLQSMNKTRLAYLESLQQKPTQ